VDLGLLGVASDKQPHKLQGVWYQANEVGRY
jgi:hypothetical protein